MRSALLFSLLVISQLSIAQLKQTNDPGSTAGKRIVFAPNVFYREFSSTTAPALKINAGDTVVTESVDAVGFDKTGTKRTERGNPLTGPFYVEGALPGDVVAISITKLALNRNYATTLETLVPKVLPKKLAKETWRSAKLVKWNLDLQTLIGTPAVVHEHLQQLKIPLHPFLGCIGVAPAGTKGISTSDSGPFGGNMDFKYNTQSATIYLPVFHAGALIYMGDGHAVQGDGELNGDALETSMDFEFTVQVIKKENMQMETPMVEDPHYIMIFGIEGNLDKALKSSTLSLLSWLQKEYALSFKEASQVIGPAVEYRIPKIAATKVEVVAMLSKEVLKGLKRVNAK